MTTLHGKIEKALAYLQDKHCASWVSAYGDPGYTQPERGIILCNWNNVPKGLADWLEKIGYELEWEDEWSICGEGKLWRMSPDCYFWEPNAIVTHDGELMTRDEGAAAWIEYLSTDRDNAQGMLPSWVTPEDLKEAGYVLFEGDKESGWHPGQTDDPHEVLKRAFEKKHDRIVFRRTEQSQFYTKWEAWVTPLETQESEDGQESSQGLHEGTQ